MKTKDTFSVFREIDKKEEEQSKIMRKYKREALDNRQEELNNKFVFTKQNVAQLASLNDMLMFNEKKILKQAKAFRDLPLLKTFSDYNLDLHIALFTDNKYYCDDPIFSDDILFPFNQDENIDMDEDVFYGENWNEFSNGRGGENHPLRLQHHCWTFHQLYDHTYLAWQDLIEVRDVWMELKIDLQNMFEVPVNKSRRNNKNTD